MEKTKKLIAVLMAVTMLLVLFSCTNNAPHVHTFSDGWSYDATSHWHEATCEHTNEVSAKAEHTFKEVTVDSTCIKEGKKSKVCTGCSYEKDIETIAKHHIDENLKCSDCGKYIVSTFNDFDKVVTYLTTDTSVENPVILMQNGEYEIKSPYTIKINNLTIEGEDGANIIISKDFKFPESTKESESLDSICCIIIAGYCNTIKNLTFTNKAKFDEEGFPLLYSADLLLLTLEGNTFTSASDATKPSGVGLMAVDNLISGKTEFTAKNNTFKNMLVGMDIVYMAAATKALSITENKFSNNTRDIQVCEVIDAVENVFNSKSESKSYYTETTCKEISKANNNCKLFYITGPYYVAEGDEITKLTV